MFGSGEKSPLLKSSTDEKAKQALADLSSSLGGGDVENAYMRKTAPSGQPASLQDRVVKELKTNWWLWGSIVFAVLLVGSLVVFRESLYDRAKHGLPFLAAKGSANSIICQAVLAECGGFKHLPPIQVKEYAADSCASECKQQQEAGQAKVSAADTESQAKLKEQYDMCYTKCVAQETSKVVEERAQFKKEEEALEKVVEQKNSPPGSQTATTAAATTAKKP